MAKTEVHNAIVSRNTSIDQGLKLRGAIFFQAPTLFDGEYPLPAFPCFPFASDKGAGMFWVPKIGDEVEITIEVDDGTEDTTDIELPEPRWRCMIYSDAADIAEEFKKNYPFRMGWKTNSGHILLFDDTNGEEFIQIKSSQGHNFILDEAKGKQRILLESIGGHKILMDETVGAVKMEIKSIFGHQMIFDDTDKSILFTHPNGTKYNLTNDGDWLEDVIRDKIEKILRNYDLNITGDKTETIGGKSTKTITGDLSETISGTGTKTITGDSSETYSGNKTINVTGDDTENITGKRFSISLVIVK